MIYLVLKEKIDVDRSHFDGLGGAFFQFAEDDNLSMHHAYFLN